MVIPATQSISIDVIDFLASDFDFRPRTNWGERHRVLRPAEVPHNRWEVSIGRPISIDVVDFSLKVTFPRLLACR